MADAVDWCVYEIKRAHLGTYVLGDPLWAPGGEAQAYRLAENCARVHPGRTFTALPMWRQEPKDGDG